MAADSKRGIPSWLGIILAFFIKPAVYLVLVFGGGSLAFWQVNKTVVNINEVLEVLVVKQEKLEIANFRIDSLLFPRARLRKGAKLEEGDNCGSLIDDSKDNGVTLAEWQKERLDRLVNLVGLLDNERKITLHVEGFASKLNFSKFATDESNKCNLAVANRRAENVSEYLQSKVPEPKRVSVERREWRRYTEMYQKRPYPYGPPPSIEPSAGLHVLNQAVRITISSP